LRPPISVEHEAGQAASVVFQVFGMTRPAVEPGQLALVTASRFLLDLEEQEYFIES